MRREAVSARMTDEQVGPALARLRLSTHLRNLRGDEPAADVVAAMHWSLSKLNRIENNKVTIQPVEVEALARHYGVHDADDVDRLIKLSLASRQRMWWRDEHLDEDYLTFVAFENDASHLYGYQAMFVPALLQTREYAQAVTASARRLPEDDPVVRNVVDIRMKRQETLLARLGGEHPPSFSHAIDEALLLRPIGGPEVMAAQLQHLLDMVRRPTVSLTVLPLRSGAHAGMGGTFELLTFSEDDDLDVVFIETPASDFLMTDEVNTATFREIMSDLLATDPHGDSLVDAVRRAREFLF